MGEIFYRIRSLITISPIITDVRWLWHRQPKPAARGNWIRLSSSSAELSRSQGRVPVAITDVKAPPLSSLVLGTSCAASGAWPLTSSRMWVTWLGRTPTPEHQMTAPGVYYHHNIINLTIRHCGINLNNQWEKMPGGNENETDNTI